jgi:regulator of replication initiation timing
MNDDPDIIAALVAKIGRLTDDLELHKRMAKELREERDKLLAENAQLRKVIAGGCLHPF